MPFSHKVAKTSILGDFDPKSAKIAKMRIFFENRALSLFYPYYALTSCKKAEKSLEPFFITFVDRLTKVPGWNSTDVEN